MNYRFHYEDKTKGDTFEARMKQVFLGVAETILMLVHSCFKEWELIVQSLFNFS